MNPTAFAEMESSQRIVQTAKSIIQVDTSPWDELLTEVFASILLFVLLEASDDG